MKATALNVRSGRGQVGMNQKSFRNCKLIPSSLYNLPMGNINSICGGEVFGGKTNAGGISAGTIRPNLDREDWLAILLHLGVMAAGAIVSGTVELGFEAIRRKIWPDDVDLEDGMPGSQYAIQVMPGHALVVVSAEQQAEIEAENTEEQQAVEGDGGDMPTTGDTVESEAANANPDEAEAPTPRVRKVRKVRKSR